MVTIQQQKRAIVVESREETAMRQFAEGVEDGEGNQSVGRLVSHAD